MGMFDDLRNDASSLGLNGGNPPSNGIYLSPTVAGSLGVQQNGGAQIPNAPPAPSGPQLSLKAPQASPSDIFNTLSLGSKLVENVLTGGKGYENVPRYASGGRPTLNRILLDPTNLAGLGIPGIAKSIVSKIATSGLKGLDIGANLTKDVTPAIQTIAKAKVSAAKLDQATPVLSTSSKAVSTTEPAANQIERGFVTSAKESPNLSEGTKVKVSGSYTPKANTDLVSSSQGLLSNGLDKATNVVHQSLSQKLGSLSDQEVSNAISVADKHDELGNFEQSSHILDQLAQHLTESGRSVQAAALLARRSPQGLLYSAQKAITQAGVPLTDSLKKELETALTAVKQAPVGSPERDYAVAAFQKLVGSKIPSSLTDKVFGVWRAGLLTGPQTIAKILTSHAVLGGTEAASNIIGSAIDKGVSLLTKQRGLVATPRGIISGGVKGVKAAGEYLKTGIDLPGTSGMNVGDVNSTINYGSSIPGKIVQAYVSGIGRVHGSLYKPFYAATHLNSLYSQALAAAKTAGLDGASTEKFVADFVSNPPPAALETAQHDAQMGTFQQATRLGEIASALQEKGGILGKIVAPFTKIPSAVATDLVNYSPVGAVKTVLEALSSSGKAGWTPAIQRQFSMGLGRSIVGTGAILPGIALFTSGRLTLDYPTDPKEQALWQLEGKQADSVLIGGQWRQLGALGPTGSVLALGGYFADSMQKDQGLPMSILAAVAGGAKSIESQSYLSGTTGVLNAINQPGQYLNNVAKQYTGSIVPTGIYTTARATDPLQRETPGPIDTLKSRIPGLRETLSPKIDAFGNDVARAGGVVQNLVDPFRSTPASSPNALTDELQRLQDAKLGVVPTTVGPSMMVGTTKVPLSQDQQNFYNQTRGQALQQTWNQIISDPTYQAMSDDNKQKTLSAAMSDANAVTRVQLLQQIDPQLAQQAYDKLSKSQQDQYNSQPAPNYVSNRVKTITKALKPKTVKAAKAPKVAKTASVKVKSATGTKGLVIKTNRKLVSLKNKKTVSQVRVRTISKRASSAKLHSPSKKLKLQALRPFQPV